MSGALFLQNVEDPKKTVHYIGTGTYVFTMQS